MSTIIKPNTFASGTVAVASEVNSNFDTIFNDYNGNITNDNIAASAGISDSKLAAISTYGKVTGPALSALASIASTAGYIPANNLPLDTDGTLAANSDSKIATQKAVKTYVAWATTVTSAVLATSQVQTLAHGLGAVPSMVQVSLTCKTTDAGWDANDEIHMLPNYYDGTNNKMFCVGIDTANVTTITDDSVFEMFNKGTGARTTLTMNKWIFKIRCKL